MVYKCRLMTTVRSFYFCARMDPLIVCVTYLISWISHIDTHQ